MASLFKHYGVITDCYDCTVRDKVVGILSFQDFCVEKQSSGDTSDRTHTKNVMAEKHGKRRKPCVKLKHSVYYVELHQQSRTFSNASMQEEIT